METTPAGVGAYAWLYDKDTKFSKKGETSKHKITLKLPKEDPETGVADPVITKFAKGIIKQHADNDGIPKFCPCKDGDKPRKKGEAPHEDWKGFWGIVFTSQYAPAVVDTKKKPLPEGVKVMSGDYVKIAFNRHEYDNGGNSGLSLRLSAVMLLEKRNEGGLGKAGIKAFGDDEQGYVGQDPDEAETIPPNDDGDF